MQADLEDVFGRCKSRFGESKEHSEMRSRRRISCTVLRSVGDRKCRGPKGRATGIGIRSIRLLDGNICR